MYGLGGAGSKYRLPPHPHQQHQHQHQHQYRPADNNSQAAAAALASRARKTLGSTKTSLLRESSSQLVPQSMEKCILENLHNLQKCGGKVLTANNNNNNNNNNVVSSSQSLLSSSTTTASSKDEEAWMPILNLVKEQVSAPMIIT